MADITGTENKDTLIGTASDDFIRGLSGNDVSTGGDGNDRLEGGDGRDTLDGENGVDIVYGGGGTDIISDKNQGNGQLFGEEGNDSLNIGRENTTNISSAVLADGGAGDDIFNLFDFSFSFNGSSLSATLLGGTGDDTFNASDVGNETTLTIDAGEGSDGNYILELAHGCY